MTENDFIRAIIENPDDDGPRLVYADWLDEHDQPERAEFIRVQVSLATMPGGDPRRAELEAVEDWLRRRYDPEWVGPLGQWVDGWQFTRGFVSTVRAKPLHLLVSRSRKRSWTPPTGWTVSKIEGPHRRQLVDQESGRERGFDCSERSDSMTSSNQGGGGTLPLSERQAVFAALVAAQDSGLSVEESRARVAEQFGLGVGYVRDIEGEGLKKEWPPLGG